MAVILFDGECIFCDATVQQILKYDKEKYFKFAAQQGKYGQEILVQYNLFEHNLETIILVEDAKVYTKSDAVLRIAKQLAGFPYFIYSLGKLVPKEIRDFLYTIIAKNRYRIFGKKDQCLVPDLALRARFLD